MRFKVGFDLIKTYRKSPYGYPSYEAVAGPHRQRLEYIGSPADTPINGDGDLARSRDGTLSQRIQSCGHAIQLPTTVVGDYDAIQPVADR